MRQTITHQQRDQIGNFAVKNADRYTLEQIARVWDVSVRTVSRCKAKVLEGDAPCKIESDWHSASVEVDDVGTDEHDVELKPNETPASTDLTDQLTDDDIQFTATKQSITFMNTQSGRVVTLSASEDNERYTKCLAQLMQGHALAAYEMADVKVAITKFAAGAIAIDGNTVSYNGTVIDNRFANRLVDMLSKGAEGIETFCMFAENLFENTDPKVVDELYDFLEHNDIELNSDGSFYAWKTVRPDYMDHYTGKIRNAPGDEPKMPPTSVDNNRNNTCSRGLHVCAKHYLPHYGSGAGNRRIVKCKVWPQHVVSVPTDYNGAKMRVWKYKVVSDVTDQIDK